MTKKPDSIQVEKTIEKSDVAKREEAILAFWQEKNIFNKSYTKPAGNDPVGSFVFYDGPPFATGLPHYGHLLAGTIKDAVPRFWTMNGYQVRRKWGWDCHGLPLENLIEKELGLASKRDIEDFGVKNFNEKARSAVLRYADEWKEIVPRFGRFVDMEDDYKTMDSSYTESVWWVFKTLHEKGLVFEGFKGMHLCPRCGTTLSNFEVNLGYKDIKDISVYVKLHLHAGQSYGPLYETKDTAHLLVWTTTPWTLPGNMAAAVNTEAVYAAVRVEGELLIVAKDNVEKVFAGTEYELVHDDIKGSDLVGLSYDPPFSYFNEKDVEKKENAWKIYSAEYVEIGKEGTGAVHLAPAYGEEDMELAKKYGIPIVHHVDYEGRFMDFVTDFAGQKVKPKDDDSAGVTHLDADIEIVKALNATGRLFKKENITHSYPHCWRDDTPLLNYATTSWFVDVPSIRESLVKANKGVHWVPEYIGSNRFGRWLEGARDWAVSRQRYWGAPLPIWKNNKTGTYKVLGSLAELQKYVPKSENTYLLMRHGEAKSNVEGIISAKKDNHDPLTTQGEEQVSAAVASLKDTHIDFIVHSGFNRTRQTAEILAKELQLSEDQLIEDERIAELQTGNSFEGKTWSEYNQQFPHWLDRYSIALTEGENRRDVQKRTGDFLFELERKYKNKTILIVSHAGTLFALESAARGWTAEDAKQYHDETNDARMTIYFENAEVRTLDFTVYPHNDNYELDFHRPYIDTVSLYDNDGEPLERIPDVFDCWFESGAMPYAETHYPFENTDVADPVQGVRFPANFIAESIDQTRGWFYSLLVLGVALFEKSPYQNVITNGLVLAEDGKKMSKSLQNYPDPIHLADTVGVDAIRYYLLSAPIMRGEDLNFSEREVIELQRKNIGRLHNVLSLYALYNEDVPASDTSDEVLDVWIIERLKKLVDEITTGYEHYELDKANRPIAEFIDDVSVWYVRRSRDRLKGEDAEDKHKALATLRYVLKTTSLVLAPAMPFYAEYLFQEVKEAEDAESVHLSSWPKRVPYSTEVLESMNTVRDVVSAALEQRTKAGLKVRQPLLDVQVNKYIPETHVYLVQDEVNVKQVVYAPDNVEIAILNTTLTDELIVEGCAREFVRTVQQVRKEMSLQPSDKVVLQMEKGLYLLLEEHMSYIARVTGSDIKSVATFQGEQKTFSAQNTDYNFSVNV